MIDEQSPASGHDYASNCWAIGAGDPVIRSPARYRWTTAPPFSSMSHYILLPFIKEHEWCFSPVWVTICFCQNKTRIRFFSSMSHYILLPFIKEHEWCFSPVWVTICLCQNKRTRIRLFSSMSYYILLPFIKEHEWCFSPVWVTICFCQNKRTRIRLFSSMSLEFVGV